MAGATATVDDEYGLEPAKPAAGVSDDEYGLEPAKKTLSNAPTRKPGETRPLTTEEVNKFQPPTKFEAGQTPEPGTTGFWGRAKQFGGDILGMGAGLAQSLPGGKTVGDIAAGNWKELPLDVLPGGDTARNVVGAIQSDVERQKEGRSPAYRAIATPAQASGLVDPIAMEESARHGDPGGVLTHAAAQATPWLIGEAARTPVGEKVIGAAGNLATRAGEKVAEMRAPGRIATFDEVLRDLTGKTPADLEFTKTLDKVRPDIAEIARKTTFDEKGNARVGEFEQQLGQREREIWSQEHKPQVEKQSHLGIDHEVVAQRAAASIDKQMRANNPAAARAADRWIASALNADAIGTVGKADNMMRSLNAANPEVPEPFKNVAKIVRAAAADEIRGQLEKTLQDAGEEGVSNPNGRWGGLREIRTAIQDRLNNPANRPLSAWDTMRAARTPMVEGAIAGGGIGGAIGHFAGGGPEGAAIGGGIGAATGFAGSVIHDVLSEPGGRIARAMKGLSKTGLQPDVVQPGTPRLPFRAGPDVSGPTSGGIGPFSPWNPPEAPPSGAGAVETTLAPDEGRIGATGREGTRFAPKGLLPAPPPEAPVGVLPMLAGPVLDPRWGTPTIQPKPGFELPNQELMGPWGTGAAPEPAPPTVKPMEPLNFPPKAGEQAPLNFNKPVREPEGVVPRGEEETETERARRLTVAGPKEAERQAAVAKTAEEAVRPMTPAKPVPEAEKLPSMEERRATQRPEGVLPGMEEHVAKQAEGAARVKGEELTDQINQPRSVDEAAARIETMSPLFRGTAASPQNEMFRPGGEAVKPMEKPVALTPGHNLGDKGVINVPGKEVSPTTKVLHTFPGEEGTRAEVAKIDKGFSVGLRDTDAGEMVGLMKIYPTEEQAVAAAKEMVKPPEEAQVKGVTEPVKAKPTKEKVVPLEKKYSREELEGAKGFVQQHLDALRAGDQPGRVPIMESREGNLNQNWTEIQGYRGIKSGRGMMPWLVENPKFTPAQLEHALRNVDSAAGRKIISSAAEFMRRENLSPEEREANREAVTKKWENTFAAFQKPRMREPGED